MNKAIKEWYEQNTSDVIALSHEIWESPELALQEFKACKASSKYLKKWGFSVEEFNVNGQGEPNAIRATWGTGKPVIGIIGEYDSLKGLGQEAVPYQSVIPGPGHGCGHNLMGSGCAAAAASLKAAMESENLPGTVVYLACPAEETIEGKFYMNEAGYFDDLDVALAWHPVGKPPRVVEASPTATGGWTVEFFGKTAHAAAEPEMGRSALDAAELMNIGVQYLREHTTEDTRMHYCYLSAGEAPNVVPEYAALNYIIRAKDYSSYELLLERVKKVAEGAALMTDTDVKWTLKADTKEGKINHSLNHVLYDAAQKLPTITYTDDEVEFAREMYKNVLEKEAPKDSAEFMLVDLEELTGVVTREPGSTDLTWVAHTCPTAWIFGFGNVLGFPGHHWSTTALAGMSIGEKGAIYGGQALAQCGYDLLVDPDKVDRCWKEFHEAA